MYSERFTDVLNKKIGKLITGRDRIVVSTLRCGRNNPGSNPGHGTVVQFSTGKKEGNKLLPLYTCADKNST